MKPQTGAAQASLDAFLKGQSNSVTYKVYINGGDTVTVTWTRP